MGIGQAEIPLQVAGMGLCYGPEPGHGLILVPPGQGQAALKILGINILGINLQYLIHLGFGLICLVLDHLKLGQVDPGLYPVRLRGLVL